MDKNALNVQLKKTVKSVKITNVQNVTVTKNSNLMEAVVLAHQTNSKMKSNNVLAVIIVNVNLAINHQVFVQSVRKENLEKHSMLMNKVIAAIVKEKGSTRKMNTNVLIASNIAISVKTARNA